MKIIILAAGKGSRLGSLTENTPKVLIDLGKGKTLLESQLKNIKESGVIDEIVIVVGYCGKQIEAKIKKYQEEGMKIKTIFNPFYDFSNNLITLWLAKNEMTKDFIITNGDNLIEKDVFQNLSKNKNGIFLTVVKKKKFYDDDMKVILSEFGVEKVSKRILNEKSNVESIGLALISGEKNVRIFKENLEELSKDKEYLNKFWLEVFNKMIEKGIRVSSFETDRRKWKEIDIHMDLKHLLEIINSDKIKNLDDPLSEEEKKDGKEGILSP